jgi:hypothetical protein
MKCFQIEMRIMVEKRITFNLCVGRRRLLAYVEVSRERDERYTIAPSPVVCIFTYSFMQASRCSVWGAQNSSGIPSIAVDWMLKTWVIFTFSYLQATHDKYMVL